MEHNAKSEIAAQHLFSDMCLKTKDTDLDTVEIVRKINNGITCPYHCNKQCEKFPIGSVVYWESSRDKIDWGIVTQHFSGEVQVQMYAFYDNRTINGIPVKQFETPTRWQKLPKKWSYNTQLFEIGYDRYDYHSGFQQQYYMAITNPKSIIKAIDDGLLVKVQENDNAGFEAEIDVHKGWRIVRDYTHTLKHTQPYHTIRFSDVYGTYEEVRKVIDDRYAEWKRQSELSDYEWIVEQIDSILNRYQKAHGNRYQKAHGISDKEKQRYRNWFMELKDLEKIEVRLYDGEIQWKYPKHFRWNSVELPFDTSELTTN